MSKDFNEEGLPRLPRDEARSLERDMIRLKGVLGKACKPEQVEVPEVLEPREVRNDSKSVEIETTEQAPLPKETSKWARVLGAVGLAMGHYSWPFGFYKGRDH